VIEDLRARLKQWEDPRRTTGAIISSGHAVLDRLLPERGFRRGGLVEWLEPAVGSGTFSLALAAAARATGPAGPLVVVDSQGEFYPPAAALAGIDLEQLILVRTSNRQDQAWAWDQSLRCPGVGAVLGALRDFSQRARRRWQLAAEAGAGLGLLVCPVSIRDEPCWAQVRLLVEPLAGPLVEPLIGPHGRRVKVELLRAPGMPGGSSVELELDDEARDVRVDSAVAARAAVRRSARA
jgi:protein ImuA